MTQHTDFLSIYPKRDTPEPQLATWLVEIKAQIATLEAAEKDYGRQLADLEKMRAEHLPGKVVEYALNGLLTSAETFMDEFLLKLATKKEIHGNLSRTLTKLRSQQLSIRTAHDGYGIGRRHAEIQAEQDAQKAAREREEKQPDYERMRSKKAYEGDEEAINWPDDVEDYEAMIADRRRGDEAARRADQQARQERQEAEAAGLQERIKEWFGKFAED